jgi:outer membrane immunogenic protein
VPSATFTNWTGCYIGAHRGGGAVSDLFIATSFAGNNSFLHGGGGFAGGQIGCNYQNGAMVLGLEGEAWSSLTNPQYFTEPTDIENRFTRNPWTAVAVDRTLLYGKAGLAAGRFEFFLTEVNPTEGQNGSATLAGLLVGGGVEYAVAPNWSLKLEYDHIDYFGRDVGFDTPFLGHFVEHQAAATDVLALGINYRFGDVPFAPAVDRAGATPAMVKAPLYKAPVAASNWTGCYAGIQGGGGILADTFGGGASDTDPVPQSSGGFAGGQLGCDVQTGTLVWGFEGEAAWSRIINRVDQSGALIQPFEISTDLV